MCGESVSLYVSQAGSLTPPLSHRHTSGKNITKGQDRALLFGAYNAPFLRGQVNWAAGLSEDSKRGLNPQLKDWLGAEAKANVGRVEGVNKVYV